MVSIFKSKKGDAVALIIAIIATFAVGVIYIIMSKPYSILWDFANSSVPAEYQSTILRLKTQWMAWPLIMVGGILLWLILTILRKQRDSGMYGYG